MRSIIINWLSPLFESAAAVMIPMPTQMLSQPRTSVFAAKTRIAGDVGPPVLDSRALFQGARELVIAHGNETYRLRLTRQNKLILTK